MRHISLVVLCILFNPGLLAAEDHQGDDANMDSSYKLVQKLMKNYQKDMLPRCEGHLPPVNVSLDLVLRSILNVDGPTQVVTVYLWQRWYWQDCRLMWNTTEYDNIEKIVVSSTRLWIPDITLYDSVLHHSTSDDHWLDGLEYYYPAVNNNGEVLLMVPVVASFSCQMDFTYFPFDRQECKIKFASWSFHGKEIDVTNHTAAGDTSEFYSNGEWLLVGLPVECHHRYYSCCKEPYPDVTFTLIIQRQYLYYFTRLVLPCLLITVIGMFVFHLPPESGEKIGLGMTVLLSLVVFLLMVSDLVPATSDTIPLIEEYFACTIILLSLSCIMTVIILNFHHHGSFGKPVPAWLYTFLVHKVSRLLCMDLSRKEKSIYQMEVDLEENVSMCPTPVCDNRDTPHASGNDQTTSILASLLTEQNKMLHEFTDHLRGTQKQDRQVEEWRKIGLVLDRVFMVLFCCVSVIVYLLIFFQNPYR